MKQASYEIGFALNHYFSANIPLCDAEELRLELLVNLKRSGFRLATERSESEDSKKSLVAKYYGLGTMVRFGRGFDSRAASQGLGFLLYKASLK